MTEHLLHDYQHWMFMIWSGAILVFIALVSAGYAFWIKIIQRKREKRISQLFTIADLTDSLDLNRNGHRAGRSVDTLFILPDISNYTRFVTNTHLPPADSQDVIFALMSEIMKVAGNSLNFSKMEGDSVLFFKDVKAVSPQKVTKTIEAMFWAFDQQIEKSKLSCASNPTVQAMIGDLSLKVIVHRGVAQRFTYRGTIDHFGSQVIKLHRLAKNGILGSRYVFVTEPAIPLLNFGETYPTESKIEVVKEIGPVSGTVFRLPVDLGTPKIFGRLRPPPLAQSINKKRNTISALSLPGPVCPTISN